MNKRNDLRQLWWVPVIVLVPVLIFFLSQPAHRVADISPATSPPPAVATSPERITVPSAPAIGAGYLGPESCRECHAERVHKFEDTAHFRAARLPASRDLKGSFEPGSNIYQTRDPNVRYEMTLEGTNYIQARIEKSSTGETRERHEVAMIYGTGQLDEVYLFWEGTRPMEMPIAYVAPLQRWINAPGFVDGRADFSHEAGLCINCHNTHLEPVAGVPLEFHREGAVLSVSCEKCHGPGSKHVAFHRASPNEKDGRFIANPSTLTRKQQNDLCSECHSDLGQPRQPLFSYRPGDKLEDFYVVPEFKRNREDQHTANHIRYLEQSKCYQKSDSLTCITCHNPHVPEGEKNSLSVKTSCLVCHQPDNCGERPKLPLAVRDRCIDCHMPERIELLTPFQGPDKLHAPGRMRHEHQIAVDRLATDQILVRHYRSLNDPDSKKKADELAVDLTRRFMAQGADYEARKQFATAMAAYRYASEFANDTQPITRALEELSGKRERVMLAMDSGLMALNKADAKGAIGFFDTALKINPKIAIAHHYLGKAYQALNQHEEATRQFNQALALEPDLPETLGHLGLSRHVLKDYDGAIAYYLKSLELEPRSSETHNNLGLAYRAKGDADKALEHYQLAIGFNTRNASAHSNLGSLLQGMGRVPEAVAEFRKAVEARPGYGDSYFNLANALRQSGDLSGAIENYRLAVDANGPPGALNNLAMLLTMTGRRAEAVPYFEKLLATQPDSVPHLVFLSRILATLDGKARNVSRAVQLATRAVSLTDGQEPNSLDALALAQAASGDFTKAVESASRAASIAERADDRGLAGAIRSRLELYRRREVPNGEIVFPNPRR